MTKAELTEARELTKNMTEFVVKINRGMSAPIINTGVCMTVTTKDGKTSDYLIINALHMGNFLPMDKLVKIEEVLKEGDFKKFVDTLQNESLSIRGFMLPKHVTRAQLAQPCNSGLLGAVIHGAYKEINNKTFGIEGKFFERPFANMDYSNFAARVKVYPTNAPAGLNMITSIEIVPNTSSEVGGASDPSNRLILVGFCRDMNSVIVTTPKDMTDRIMMRAEDCDFVDTDLAVKAANIRSTIDIAAETEKLDKDFSKLQITHLTQMREFTDLKNRFIALDNDNKTLKDELAAARAKIERLSPKKKPVKSVGSMMNALMGHAASAARAECGKSTPKKKK